MADWSVERWGEADWRTAPPQAALKGWTPEAGEHSAFSGAAWIRCPGTAFLKVRLKPWTSLWKCVSTLLSESRRITRTGDPLIRAGAR